MTTYMTPDGCVLTYDPSLDAWTNGDLTFPTKQLVEDLKEFMAENAEGFDDCFGPNSGDFASCKLSPSVIRSARKAFMADQDEMRRDIERLQSAGKFESLDDIRRAHEARSPDELPWSDTWKGYLVEDIRDFFKGRGTFDGIHGITHIETTFYPEIYGGRLFVTREHQRSKDGRFERVDFMVYEARPCGEIELHWRAPSKERAIEGALETVASYDNGYSINDPEYMWGYLGEDDMIHMVDGC